MNRFTNLLLTGIRNIWSDLRGKRSLQLAVGCFVALLVVITPWYTVLAIFLTILLSGVTGRNHEK
jgi:chromate transport protein ChrA